MMVYVELILSSMLMVVSLLGYVFFLTIRKEIRVEFSPAIVLSSLSVIMIVSGILNVMLLMSVVLLLFGVALFITLLVRKEITTNVVLAPSNIFILFVACLLAWRTYKILPTTHDNFSHWLVIVKYMFHFDSLPSFKTELVAFKAYPTATSSLLYYLTRFIGYREDFLLFFQSVIMYSFILPMFAFVKNKNLLSWSVLFSFIALITARLVYFPSLLVDELLAFCGIGAAAIAYYYKHTPKKAAICLAPVGLFISLTKNSGIFFVLLTTILLVVLAVRSKRTKTQIRDVVLLSLVLPLIGLFLWTRHVTFAFHAGMESKHALNIKSYFDYFLNQNLEILRTRFVGVMHHFLNLSNERIRDLLILSVIFAVLSTFVSKRSKIRVWKSSSIKIILAFGIYLLWGLLLVVLYLTSMQGIESESLAGLSRYHNTIVLFLIGILYMCILQLIGQYSDTFTQWKQRSVKFMTAIVSVFVVLIPVLLLRGAGPIIHKTPNSGIRVINKELGLDSLQFPQSARFLVATDDSSNYSYLTYVFKYELLSNNVSVRQANESSNYDEVFKNSETFDYIIVASHDSTLNQEAAKRAGSGASDKPKIIALKIQTNNESEITQ